MKDVGAAMATMTDNGMPAADAATRLHMAISLMEAPTGQAEKALQSIGMTQFQLADDMRTKGLLAALQDLQTSLVKSGDTADQQAAVLLVDAVHRLRLDADAEQPRRGRRRDRARARLFLAQFLCSNPNT